MDPRDGQPGLVDGAECAACGRPVPREQVRVLAERDDLAFAELPCAACGSVSLAIFVADGTDADAGPDDSRAGAPPIGPDDVVDMHAFLAGWTGDLQSLVQGPGDGRAGTPRPPSPA